MIRKRLDISSRSIGDIAVTSIGWPLAPMLNCALTSPSWAVFNTTCCSPWRPCWTSGATSSARRASDPPRSYADIFRVLRDESLLTGELAERLMAMARFRNVLVHLYAEVDEERVLKILRSSLGDLDAFVNSLRQRFAQDLKESEEP